MPAIVRDQQSLERCTPRERGPHMTVDRTNFFPFVKGANKMSSLSGAAFDMQSKIAGVFQSKMVNSGAGARLQAILEDSQNASNHKAIVEIIELCDAELELAGHHRLASVQWAQTISETDFFGGNRSGIASDRRCHRPVELQNPMTQPMVHERGN